MPAENGYVPTPAPAAEVAVGEVFAVESPDMPASPRLLLPGLGTGNLYDAVVRYCTEGEGNRDQRRLSYPMPDCVGVENDPDNVGAFEMTHPDHDVDVRQADFLLDPPEGEFDWVLANPPYTRYSRLSSDQQTAYRDRFETASGKFPLFAPFVEQSLELLKPDGCATFILPVQMFTADACDRLRELLARRRLGRIRLLPGPTFDRQVQTVVLSLENTPSDTREHPFWMERLYDWECAMQRFLRRVGVDDVEEAEESYEHELAGWKSKLRGNSQRAFYEWAQNTAGRSSGGSAAESSNERATTLDEFG